jgi:hypothetical protein
LLNVSQLFLSIRDCMRLFPTIAVVTCIVVSGCSTKPLSPYMADTPPLILVPAVQAGIEDQRGRFREIFCAVLEERGTTLPDYRPCDEALARVGLEPEGTGRSVELGQSKRNLVAMIVPGVGWDCFANWLDLENSVKIHIQNFGFDAVILKVDGLSSSANNARQIRDAIMAMEVTSDKPNLVLIGYSKGAPDILEAIVTYPEIRSRIAAVVSAAGSIGGSPLANDVKQSQLAMLRNWPDAECTKGDGGAIESLRPATRKAWLAENPLPRDFAYYSLVTYPQPDHISSILRSTYNKLSKVDGRNDSQMLFYDQIIPASTLIGFVNADHWALAVPIARKHTTLGSTFVDQNSFPREALLEAVLRFVEEDLPEQRDE